MDESMLLKSDDLRGLFRVSSATIAKWRKGGILPYVKIGAIIRYRSADVALFLSSIKAGRAA